MKTKSNMTVTKPNNKWEIEYDGQFGGLTGEVIDKYDLDAIKLFISKTLQQQREEIIKEIESNYLMPNGGIEIQSLEWEHFKKENK